MARNNSIAEFPDWVGVIEVSMASASPKKVGKAGGELSPAFELPLRLPFPTYINLAMHPFRSVNPANLVNPVSNPPDYDCA
jgi:hypothetical protein